MYGFFQFFVNYDCWCAQHVHGNFVSSVNRGQKCKNIMNKKMMNITLSNTIGSRKERLSAYTFLFMTFIMKAPWPSQHSYST
jgi:hypothetical protein